MVENLEKGLCISGDDIITLYRCRNCYTLKIQDGYWDNGFVPILPYPHDIWCPVRKIN